jgi:hypothetical protein
MKIPLGYCGYIVNHRWELLMKGNHLSLKNNLEPYFIHAQFLIDLKVKCK